METDINTEKVFKKIQKCFESLVGSSGHLASYSMKYETFQISKIEKLENNAKYYFTAKAYYESEFTVYSKDSAPEIHQVSGSIILDKDFNYVRDDEGQICLEPYKCIDPERFKDFEKKEDIKKIKPPDKDKTKTNGAILSQEEINDLLDYTKE